MIQLKLWLQFMVKFTLLQAGFRLHILRALKSGCILCDLDLMESEVIVFLQAVSCMQFSWVKLIRTKFI